MEKSLEIQLAEALVSFKTHIEKSGEEFTNLGRVTKDTADVIAKLQKQVDALDEKMQHRQFGDQGESLIDALKKDESVQRIMKDGRGRCTFVLKGDHTNILKTTILSDTVGTVPRQTTGVLPIERTAGITAEARRALQVIELLSSRPTSFQVIDFVKVTNALANAAEQSPEGAVKSENAVTFESVSERVKTIATWVPASKQILADWAELQSFLETGLKYYVAKEKEEQLLFGTGVAETLHGLVPQATAFNTGLLGSSYTKIDILGYALAQIDIANEIPGTFIILHPQDLWDIRLTKDTQGRYILGDPQSPFPPALFQVPLVGTTAMPAGTFLVGSGSPSASEIRQRQEVVVEISTEHSDYFTRNLVAIRAEERLALVTYRPASYISGSLTPSPA